MCVSVEYFFFPEPVSGSVCARARRPVAPTRYRVYVYFHPSPESNPTDNIPSSTTMSPLLPSVQGPVKKITIRRLAVSGVEGILAPRTAYLNVLSRNVSGLWKILKIVKSFPRHKSVDCFGKTRFDCTGRLTSVLVYRDACHNNVCHGNLSASRLNDAACLESYFGSGSG